jgi:urocanate hydratase
MEGIRTDGKTIHVNDEGYLEVIGGTGGGVVDEDSIREIIESYKYLDKIETLTIYNSSNSTILSYDGKSPKSLTLNKNLIGLSNVENTALSTWTGSTNINKVGTITSGTWNGSSIGAAYLPTATTSAKGVASFD